VSGTPGGRHVQCRRLGARANWSAIPYSRPGGIVPVPVLPSAVNLKSGPHVSRLAPGPGPGHWHKKGLRQVSAGPGEASFTFLLPLPPACHRPAGSGRPAPSCRGKFGHGPGPPAAESEIGRPLEGRARPLRAAGGGSLPVTSALAGRAWRSLRVLRLALRPRAGDDGEAMDGPVDGWPGTSADPAGRGAADDGAAVGVHILRQTHWAIVQTLGGRCPRIGIRPRNLGGWHDCALAHIRSVFHARLSAGISSTLLHGLEHPRIHRPAASRRRSESFRQTEASAPAVAKHPIPTDRPTTVPETAGCVIAQPRAALRWLIAASARPRSARGPSDRSTHDRAPHAPLHASDFHSASIRRARRKSDPIAIRLAESRAQRGEGLVHVLGAGACTRLL
jgi:hypothetical protein